MSYELVKINEPFHLPFSKTLVLVPQIRLLEKNFQEFTLLATALGTFQITVGLTPITIEVVKDILEITLLLLYTESIVGYNYKNIIYTSSGRKAYDLTYDYQIPIKIKKPEGAIDLFLEKDNNITYSKATPRIKETFLGTIIIDPKLKNL